ncbi:MBL fold metallo-hydrolase [Candidatus Woesearchaeota archaeon]|nr:MBL fold metallo-hydrolase [Candidatus Woesearchaeota archaeon]
MKIGIAGARGSIPTPTGKTLFNREISTAKYGGNTTCVYVMADDGTKHILDAGTGIRDLGVYLSTEGGFNGHGEANLYFSHTHWDHIQGLPFFVPAYIPGNKITVFGEAKVKGIHLGVRPSLESALAQHSDQPGNLPGLLSIEGDGLRRVLANQQNFRNFPAPLEALKGIENYVDFVAGATIYETATLKIDTCPLNHPGNSISYRFTEKKADGRKKVLVFSTDFEPDADGADERVTAFWGDADMVLADGQYEPQNSDVKVNPFMVGWGHSDYRTDLCLAAKAGVKLLVLTHHEPKMGEAYHDQLEERAKQEAVRNAEKTGCKTDIELAKEGSWYTL